jgi:ribosomal protein S18 acetylase RimI-like enzyme
MGTIIAELGLDEARQIESFARQRAIAEVRIIAVAGQEVGWVQTAPTHDAINLGQLYIDRRYQRQGIGQTIVALIAEEAARDRKAITLGVVKINPARRLYERLGFEITHEDEHKIYMRRAVTLKKN